MQNFRPKKISKISVMRPFLLPVFCKQCGWKGRRTAKFRVNLHREFTVKHALSYAAGRLDRFPCPHCNESIIYVWPKMRDPKQQPECGDALLLNADGKQETRHVLDRNLGGDVIYSVGRPPTYYSNRFSCTSEEWTEWSEDAVVVKVAEGVPA